MSLHWADDLNSTGFYLEMLATLTSALERVVGLEDAEGYLALVGAEMGHDFHMSYCATSPSGDLPVDRIANVLVDLKAHIDGGFSIEAVENGKITLVNTRCPFGEKVKGRQSLCMMTSTLFGTISAEAAGQANVDIQQSIAAGDPGCRVVIHLNQPEAPGKRYFGSA
jgi:predicted ArsR family transcriptional regulator